MLSLINGVLPSMKWLDDPPLLRFASWLALQLPLYIVQVLPVSVFLATLFVLGRLVSSGELRAWLAGGVSPARLAAPFVAVSAVAALIALGINQFVLPVSSPRQAALWWQMTEGNSGLWRLEGMELPVGKYRLSFSDSDTRTDLLYGVRLTSWRDGGLEVFIAERAVYEGHEMSLFQVDHVSLSLESLESGEVEESSVLLDELIRVSEASDVAMVRLPRTKSQLITQYSGGSYDSGRSILRLAEYAGNPNIPLLARYEAKVLMHRKLVEVVANVALLLLALPLTMTFVSSRTVALGLALIATLAWYLLLSIGISLALSGVIPAWLGAWGGIIVVIVLGLALNMRLRFR
ncbi:MAG TPA: LptF/LptG family permease [Trueperaceae bacterium]